MKLFVNDKEIILFDGSTVTDALRKYDDNAVEMLKQDKAEVLDKYGNVTGLDGALIEGSRLFYRIKNN